MGSQEFYGFFRYDYLLFYALIIQVCLVYLKLESWAEAKVDVLFHIMAMVMEIFLTHPQIASWQYPQPAIFKILTVPLFAGFSVFGSGQFFCTFITVISGVIWKASEFFQYDLLGGAFLY